MASWSNKRKYGYFFGFALSLAVLGGIPAFLVFYEAPTCFDDKQNGGERGLDCGGRCIKLCPADFALPRIMWSYSMRVVPSVYNSLAYVQNPNPTVEAPSIGYLFKLYDSEGLLVAERRGSAFLPAGQKIAIFEGGIRTGERLPAKTTFEFLSEPEWKPGRSLSQLRVLDTQFSPAPSPRVEARIKNDSRSDGLSSVDAFVILYDADDNRVAFSKTVISRIDPGETQEIYFTWPEGFAKPIVRTEVLFVDR